MFVEAWITYSHQTYPQIKKDKSDVITDSNYYGGGMQDEHFIVWMRLAGVPHFRKLYGRIRDVDLKKGDTLVFDITSNFEVSSFEGTKGLVLATENFIGGRNFGIVILFVISSLISFAITGAILLAERYFPEYVVE